ncbi:hypothetical protein OKA04_00240 [Luteolibacter flavescens]|uniref:Uncharacterized protein n=1 Tax=Luteolibacter flavescens TaxID=1859460 RepID=A0ABT3FJG1_9BACT|nr:hypothetical protein [Luteolibacter flavescens]MCW1883135.1 hypothetical protein [Luteolibacter flavescens]
MRPWSGDKSDTPGDGTPRMTHTSATSNPGQADASKQVASSEKTDRLASLSNR